MNGTLKSDRTGTEGWCTITEKWANRSDFIVYCQCCGKRWGVLTHTGFPDNVISYDSVAHLCFDCGSGSFLAVNEALEYTDFTIPDELLAEELLTWFNNRASGHFWVQGTYYV